MARINEINEQRAVVQSVGSFASSLQQIAAARMVKLRKSVMAARHFVEEATVILRELQLERTKIIERELQLAKASGKKPSTKKEAPVKAKEVHTAVIVVSSNQGLSGSYNTEIFKKVEEIAPEYRKADFFVIGKKGQEFFVRFAKKNKLRYFPYNIPEDVGIEDLRPLIGMFYYYDQIRLIYSKYINTTTREVVFVELTVPNVEEVETKKEKDEGKFIFEPSLEELISSVTAKLRYALFRQQILDSKLSLYTAQMIAMQTASENADDLLKELQLEYNKARRKVIDKKIQEVQGGRTLWAE